MKGAQGLLIAVALGIVGAFCNFFYLANKGRELAMVDFIAINKDQRISVGDKFNESNFMRVSIPGDNVGTLDQVAVHWKDMATVIGEPATKPYVPGELLLQRQIRTPPEMDIKKLLAADERLLWIPVDTRTFVPALVNAGDVVSFIVPRLTPVSADEGGDKHSSSSTENIGPFRILSLGNRLGSQDVLRASGVTASQENIMGVAFKIVGGDFDEKGQRLLDSLRLTNFQQVQVFLHPSPEAPKGTK